MPTPIIKSGPQAPQARDAPKAPDYRPSAAKPCTSAAQLTDLRQPLPQSRQTLMEEVAEPLRQLRDQCHRDVGDESDRATREASQGMDLRTRDRCPNLLREIAFVAILVVVATSFFVSHYVFRWRTAMNDYYVARWGEVRTIEGAAQRIQEDTMRFADIVETLGVKTGRKPARPMPTRISN